MWYPHKEAEMRLTIQRIKIVLLKHLTIQMTSQPSGGCSLGGLAHTHGVQEYLEQWVPRKAFSGVVSILCIPVGLLIVWYAHWSPHATSHYVSLYETFVPINKAPPTRSSLQRAIPQVGVWGARPRCLSCDHGLCGSQHSVSPVLKHFPHTALPGVTTRDPGDYVFSFS